MIRFSSESTSETWNIFSNLIIIFVSCFFSAKCSYNVPICSCTNSLLRLFRSSTIASYVDCYWNFINEISSLYCYFSISIYSSFCFRSL